MKVKILIPLLLIFSVLVLKAQDISKQNFQQAFEEISAMLAEKQPLDFERAVFITENAYRENSFQHEDFKSALDVHSSIIEQFIKANDKYDWKQFVRGNMGIAPDMEIEAKERYRKALANYAIFTYLTDTLTVKFDGQVFLHLPYTYSNDDPFGTTDWKNSQTMNLLETQKGNCYSLVTLFKILSERFKSEANIGTAPQHIYIEHRDPKGSRFNVEVATRSFPDFGSIQTLTYTTREALLNDISMRKLDLKQSVGLFLVYLAKGYEYKNKIKDDEFILTCANTALQHDSKNLNALLLKAQVYEQRVMMKQMPSAPYEKMLADFYKLGYRQMPDDMKEIILSKIQGRPSTVTPTDKTPNTFEGIGEQARVVTLSNGLFEELHKPQKIVRYGQTIFDTEKSKIVKFLDEDISSYQVDPEVFALSVDPLTKSYPWYTPYQFAGNSPILNLDLDGLEEQNYLMHLLKVYLGIGPTPTTAEEASKQSNEREAVKKVLTDIEKMGEAYDMVYGTILPGYSAMYQGIGKGNYSAGILLGVFEVGGGEILRPIGKVLQPGARFAYKWASGQIDNLVSIAYKYSDEVKDIVSATGRVGETGSEIITTTMTGKRDDAFKVVKDIMGGIPDDAEAISGKFGSQQDGIVGWSWKSSEGKTNTIRIDYDANKGAHYNWTKGKEKGAVTFDSSQDQVDRIIKNEIIKSEK